MVAKINNDKSEEKVIYFGRPGNNLKMGIVGLPNVGKSTFFNILTKNQVPAENYPFCTINPHESRTEIPDDRFKKLCSIYKPNKCTPAYLIVTDIAGLIRNAASGEGLGNSFLSNIKATDGLFHVLRAFKDPKIVHVEGTIDPIRDLSIIANELRFKDLEHAEKAINTLENSFRSGVTKEKKEELQVIKKANEFLKNGIDIRNGKWEIQDIIYLNKYQFLSAKKIICLANISKDDFINKKNSWLSKIYRWLQDNSPGSLLIPFSADYEKENSFESNINSSSSSIPKILKAGYNALELIVFFTVGPDEVRAWTIRKGTKAPQAAGVIHSDFERGFIAAEVIPYDCLIEFGSETAVKNAGKLLHKGKDYIVQDGDIIHFKFNVTTSKKR